MSLPHIAVLPNEIIKAFEPVKNKTGYIIDCTVGFGTHSQLLLQKYPSIKLICIDQDIEALEFCKNSLKSFKDRVLFFNKNFSDIKDILDKYEIIGVLADIGLSSYQLDNPDRGFGFTSQTLDMRMNLSSPLSAYEVVNTYSKSQLEEIFQNFGEIKSYKKVAHLITEKRKEADIKDAMALTNLLHQNMKNIRKGLHPATLVFQAIRIEVNKELEVLASLLKEIENAKLQDAIISIISFHSLEDKIVKDYFRRWSKSCLCNADAQKCTCGNNNAKGKVITKKPIIPTKEEITNNSRSRSSKLRVFHFCKIKNKYSK